MGTVEFLLDAEPAQFCFLEMNTRIQVEHRVTEEVVGCDLVWWQIQCARGEPLDWEQDDVDLTETHAVEVRLYAEDPAQDWLPATGTIHRFDDDEFHDEYVIVDSGVTLLDDGPAQLVVTTHFDPLLAKFTARGYTPGHGDRAAGALPDRAGAARGHHQPRLPAGRAPAPRLPRGQHHHPVRGRPPGLLEAGPDAETVALHVAAACLVDAERRRRPQPWPFAPPGWRNVGVAPHRSAASSTGGRTPRG